LFVWPATQAPAANGKASEQQGYNVIRWSNAGMTYWAVSDLNLAELQQFVQLLQEQTYGCLLAPSAYLCVKKRSKRRDRRGPQRTQRTAEINVLSRTQFVVVETISFRPSLSTHRLPS
jgi:hypothetical protein